MKALCLLASIPFVCSVSAFAGVTTADSPIVDQLHLGQTNKVVPIPVPFAEVTDNLTANATSNQSAPHYDSLYAWFKGKEKQAPKKSVIQTTNAYNQHVPQPVGTDVTDALALKSLTQLDDNSAAAKSTAPKYHFEFIDGSLHQNMQRFVKQFHYQLIWHVYDADNGQFADFHHIGIEKLSAESVPKIAKQVMQPYAVQVKVWQANKVMCVTTDGQCE